MSSTQFTIDTTATQYKMAGDPSSAFDTFRHPLELRYASKSTLVSSVLIMACGDRHDPK